jgi:heme A synthase
MKTLGRILIILIVAFIVTGATYAILQTAVAQALTGNATEMGQMEDRPAPSDFANGQSALSNELGGRLEGRGGLVTLEQNLLKIAAIVAAVQVLWSIGRRLKLATASLVRQDRLKPSRSS